MTGAVLGIYEIGIKIPVFVTVDGRESRSALS